jgi:hypothetical protein
MEEVSVAMPSDIEAHQRSFKRRYIKSSAQFYVSFAQVDKFIQDITNAISS